LLAHAGTQNAAIDTTDKRRSFVRATLKNGQIGATDKQLLLVRDICYFTSEVGGKEIVKVVPPEAWQFSTFEQ